MMQQPSNLPQSHQWMPSVNTTQSTDIYLDWQSARNSAVAGYAAGMTGVILGHPLDSAKVWLQTNSVGKNPFWSSTTSSASTTASVSSSLKSSSMPRISHQTPKGTASLSTMAIPASSSSSPPSSTRRIFRTLRALYSGAMGPLCTVGIVQSINFATYDATRRVLHHRDQQHQQTDHTDYLHKDSLTNVALAGFCSGTALAFITSPLILIKTHQQITGQGFRQALQNTLLHNGSLRLSFCLVGIYPHFLSETVGRALYYSVYEACKRSRATSEGTVSLAERMASAALAGICCWAVIFPLDSLRNRLYSQQQQKPPLRSTLEMARVLYREGALYRGFGLTVLRAGPVAAAVLPVYDLVLEHLATTSTSV